MTRRDSISATLTRRALGIDNPRAHAIARITALLEAGFAVDSRRRADGTWTHRRATTTPGSRRRIGGGS